MTVNTACREEKAADDEDDPNDEDEEAKEKPVTAKIAETEVSMLLAWCILNGV